MNSRERFEAHAAPMGFDLTRQTIAVPEPWSEYVNEQTGYFWAGWQAAERNIWSMEIAELQPCDEPLTHKTVSHALKELLK